MENKPVEKKKKTVAKDVEFVAKNVFSWNGHQYGIGEKILIKSDLLEKETAKGKHPGTKKWLSPILNHCERA